MTSQTFRQRSGYEDLDKSHQSSNERCHNGYDDDNDGDDNNDCDCSGQQLNQGERKTLSMSDTAIHLTPHPAATPAAAQTFNTSPFRNQSTLNLSHGILSIGSSFRLVPPIPRLRNSLGNLFASEDGSMDGASLLNMPHSKYLKHRSKENVWLICYVCFYVFYLTLGSLCFCVIETPIEQDIRASLRLLRSDFLAKYPQILDDDLEEFLTAVITANDRGISPLRNASNDMNWSFGQALFFSSTVVTTIGYGHVTPLSQTGKIFCMIYATLGIPLTLVLLSAVVERLLVPANWLLGILNTKLGHLYQPFNIRLLHLSIIVVIVAILFFAIPTTIFAYLESAWGVLDAFYYCFISLTTIGLGDYIPGDGVSADNRSLYKMMITTYLIFGLIAVMFVLTIFYDIPQLNLGQLFTESVNGETEKLRLSSNNTTCYSGPSGLYMPQRDEDTRRAVVRIRPHGGDDSPSGDEATSSSLNRDGDMRNP